MQRFERSWGYAIELASERDAYTIGTEHIPPGRWLRRHYHLRTREVEVLLRGIPMVLGKPTQEGDVFVWEKGQVHDYDNRHGHIEAVVLTISLPGFDPEDELFLND